MSVFLFIVSKNILPIFVLVIVGYLTSLQFDLDVHTLSKLNFYILIPSFTFINIYSTKIPIEMVNVFFIASLIMLTNSILSLFVGKFRSYDTGLKNAFANSIMFYNSGNISIPLITLVFTSEPFVVDGETPYLKIALTAQIMVLIFQNLTINTIGFLNAGKANSHWKETLISIIKLPALYAVPLAFILKNIDYRIDNVFIWPALVYASNALVPVALITLGVQLSKTSFKFKNIDVYISAFIRLIIGPCLALILVALFRIDGVIAQVIIISSAAPTAVNSALVAVEKNNHPDFSSQVVLTSTVLCSISLVFVIYIARVLFPAY